MKTKTFPFFYFGIVLLLVPYLMWFILGENSYITIHDNLDGEFGYIKVLLESNNLFGFNLGGEIPSIMNGIDRSFFRSGLNLTFLIFYIFPPIFAYIIHHMIVHLIGYIGIFLLLKRYFVPKNDFLVFSISLCFGFLSYYHIQYGISISGQPLLFLAFLNLLKGNRKIYNWIIIGLFPFFSFLPVTLPFFIPILFFLGLWNYNQTHNIPVNFITGILVICVISVLIDFNLIYSTLYSSNISHRVEFVITNIAGASSFKQVISSMKKDLRFTYYHAGVLIPLRILYSVAVGSAFGIQINKLTKTLLGLLLAISFWVALNPAIGLFLGNIFVVFRSFTSSRFFYLSPFIWLLLLAVVLNEYNWNVHIQKFFAIAFLVATFHGILINNVELTNNWKIITAKSINLPTFGQFYDEEIFTEIKDYIGPENIENYAFLSIGFFPNILQYNGFNTLDSYQNNYSLSYKYEFRKIIAAELERNKDLQLYYDYWGSRCYAFSSQLGKNYLYKNNSRTIITTLEYDYKQIKNMGGRYILSAVPIERKNEHDLIFLRSFTFDESYWKLYLYEIY